MPTPPMHVARLCRALTLPLILVALAIPLETRLSAAGDRKPPYWQSLRADEVNMRVGPGEDYGVRFVYHRKHLPVRILRIKENWRLVEDPDGVRGWMVVNFLSNERSATVKGKGAAEMRAGGSDSANLLWKIAPGAVGKLGNCGNGWCQLNIDNHLGYVREEQLWGVGEP